VRKHVMALVVGLLLAPGARAQDAEADAAATKFLTSKALATTAIAPDQWLGSYAGSCWVGALEIAVTEEKAEGLRKIELLRVTGREKKLPARDVERWWVDAQGLVVKGEKAAFEAGSSEMEKASHRAFTLKNAKLKLKAGEEDEEVASIDLPAAFVPNELLAVLFVPDEKGKRYRFARLGEEEGKFAYFTVEDMGKEKTPLRSGDATARKVKVTESDGAEGVYFLDDQRKVVAASWPAFPHVTAFGGTEAESKADWWTRPQDDADKAGDRLAQGAAKLDALVNEFTYGIYDEGRKKTVVKIKLTKEASGYRYVASIADVRSAGAATEEWMLSPEGKVLSGSRKETGEEATESKVKVEGDKITATTSKEGSEPVTYPVPPRFVPDAFLLFRAVAGEKGELRFHGFELDERYPYSILLAAKAEEEIDLPGGKVKARRVDFAQDDTTGSAWLDAQGKILLVIWKSGDVSVFAPEDQLKDRLRGSVGPAKKED